MPLERCALFVHNEKIPRAACTAWPHQPHSMCALPFFNLWIRPWGRQLPTHEMMRSTHTKKKEPMYFEMTEWEVATVHKVARTIFRRVVL